LAYRSSRHVFPTPESPIINSLICMSKGFSCRAIFSNGACVERWRRRRRRTRWRKEREDLLLAVCLFESREKTPCNDKWVCEEENVSLID